MRSGPVLLLVIAFAVLYLAATGRLTRLVKAIQEPLDAAGDAYNDASSEGEPGGDQFEVRPVSVPRFIGGADGRGVAYTADGWRVL